MHRLIVSTRLTSKISIHTLQIVNDIILVLPIYWILYETFINAFNIYGYYAIRFFEERYKLFLDLSYFWIKVFFQQYKKLSFKTKIRFQRFTYLFIDVSLQSNNLEQFHFREKNWGYYKVKRTLMKLSNSCWSFMAMFIFYG